jgi:glutamate-ammonia-ligase adenylyltransferase
VEAIAHRSVYLALLSENAGALEQMIKLSSASPWIAEYIARHPILLDELIDPRILYAPSEKSDLTERLNRFLTEAQSGGLESEMDALRQFKHAQVLKVAAADIAGLLEVPMVSTRLTAIAECTVTAALNCAWRDLTLRHGEPCYRVDDQVHRAGFAIIAYGKLGSLELGYGSDLDLVFLHDSSGIDQSTTGSKCIDNAVFFTRLAQRIIHILSTLTPAGQAYEIDTRLRPSGGSGLLVSSTAAFADYQQRNAWTWEHQALVRARPIAGDVAVRTKFARVRAEALARPRDTRQLLEDVKTMRKRMFEELNRGSDGRFDLKQGPGGITDIEFVVQYAVLRHAKSHPSLMNYTANCDLLDALASAALLTNEQRELLRKAYFAIRGRIHELALQQQPAVVPDSEFTEERASVRAIWRAIMKTDYCEENEA